MTDVINAVSILLDARDAFLNAFEKSVVASLPEIEAAIVERAAARDGASQNVLIATIMVEAAHARDIVLRGAEVDTEYFVAQRVKSAADNVSRLVRLSQSTVASLPRRPR